MGLTGFVIVVVVALAVGFAVQYAMKTPLNYEWLIVSLALAFGAIFASETFPGSGVFSGVTNWGPELDGLVVIPAIIGGGLLALAADVGIRTGPEPRTV